MSFYGNRALSRFGGVFGAFGKGEVPVFGPYTMSDCALSNFYDTANYAWLKAHGRDGGANYFTSINYTPPSGTLKAQALTGYNYLLEQKDLGNALAEAKFAQLDGLLKTNMAQASALADAHDDRLGCGNRESRGWSAQEQLWQTFEQIVKLMKQFATAPSTVPKLTIVDAPPPGPTAVVVRSNSAITTSSGAGAPGETGSVPETEGGGGFPWLYVGLGVGGLALLGGVFALSRRSSKVSGYRRRRRSRR